MNPIEHIKTSFAAYLQKNHALSLEVSDSCNFVLNVDANKQNFGDLSSNAALVLASQSSTKTNPRLIAQTIGAEFTHPYLLKIEIAGPGFLNAFLTPRAYTDCMAQLIEEKEQFFVDAGGKKNNYNIEFVSANPTGPLHLGHGRGAIIGDVLTNILRFCGHSVTKEFYINDAGNQIYKLGTSFKIRCQQLLGVELPLPEDGYQGEYLIDLAQQCIQEYGPQLLEKPEPFFEEYAKKELLERIKQTLQKYGVTFDVWFSEKVLHESGNIQQAISHLQDSGYIYEHEGALWFVSTRFGDDKDRVVKKSMGPWTYVAADIAYLLNKAKRGYDHLIMILGHDHHSYAVRLEGIRQALGLDRISLDIILYQLVTMKASGQLVQMSKRAGTMVTLKDVIDEVGTDVARFFYLNRKADAQLEFDLDLALKKTEENPVYYVQYAYVRTGSILAKSTAEPQFESLTPSDALHISSAEYLLLKKIISLKTVLESIGHTFHTHQLANYTIELADLFHRYYALHKVVDSSAVAQSRARLMMVKLIRQTFDLCFTLLGISKPEKM